ncbi:ParB/RepB/Spo0J family partition protein [Roseobacter sp. YSTF-M11]|uniref:ParB/RepB/Spo0J family partition protein n=1 Tax=Roseobacter insulae TaxID=2859783 RepID=A0A9X1FV83_9RHOB|nr:ParB N-terminal domain-containing protein [Roseobacter insulae]MBW4708303.1 ParB/RepB/Spo0J family partition protein [Roseobacter insulae]
MSKRRVFDIDFDEAAVPAGTDNETPARRGPMAAAISENAEALGVRQAAEAEIRAENDRLAHEYVALKKNGQIVGLVPLDDVKMSKLVRDRAADRDPDLDELKASILAVGLSNPIHVEETESGYELIQGFRRLSAFRELRAETGEARFNSIPATLQARGAQLDVLYRRMVDENLVRRDISFAEMAQLAMSYAGRSGQSVAAAIDGLYASAGRQKRSYIRHFAHLLTVLGNDLKFPEAIPRATGLSLVKLLEDNPRFAGQVRAVLNSQPARDAVLELSLLRSAVTGGQSRPKASKPSVSRTSARTTIKLNRPEGVAKVTASSGRFEVALDHDFGAIEPRRLEAAARAFLDRLKD